MNKLDIAFKIIWGLALVLFLFIIYSITISSSSEIRSLLMPLGVLISAMLASVSLMKSIENTNKIEKEKIKRELYEKRKKIIFTIFDLRVKLQVFDDKNKRLTIKSAFVLECIDILKDSYFIFDHKETKTIDIIFKKLMQLHSHLLEIEKTNYDISKEKDDVLQLLKRTNAAIDENDPLYIKYKEAKTMALDLLEEIKDNIDSLNHSIKLTQNK